MHGPRYSIGSPAGKAKIIGSILGGAIGDCLGGPYEGKPGPVNLSRRDDWNISDDTLLTVATCEAIIERGVAEPGAIADRLGALYSSGALRSPGASTLKAVTELSHGGHWALVGRKGAMAAGNGAAMRIAPVAFCLNPLEERPRRIIRDICRITHHNDEAYAGALAIAISIRSAWDSGWPEPDCLFELLLDYLPDTSVKDRIAELSALSVQTSLAEIGKSFGSSGYVVESVPLAILGASRILALDFRRVLEELAMIGGDTDTIASMAGQIMGCVVGRGGIPDEMVVCVPGCDDILEVASRLADIADTIHHQRSNLPDPEQHP